MAEAATICQGGRNSHSRQIATARRRLSLSVLWAIGSAAAYPAHLHHAVCPGFIPPAFVAHDRRWEDSFCLRPSEPPGTMSFRSRLLLGRPFRPGVTPSPSCCRVRCGRHIASSAFDFIEPLSHPCSPTIMG